MVEVKVNSGICGFNTTIKVESQDMQNAVIHMESECGNIKKMSSKLKEVDGFKECFSKVGECECFKIGRECSIHAACPVPTAIIKGIEVACGLALPKDVDMKIEKNE